MMSYDDNDDDNYNNGLPIESKPKRKCTKQLLRNDMKYETKAIYMIDGRKLRFDLTFLDLTNIIYFVKHYYGVQHYRPFSVWLDGCAGWMVTATTTKNFRERKVIRLRNAIAHTKTKQKQKKMCIQLWVCFFHFCVTWQLRTTTWCVNPFVTVVTNAMIQKHNLVITTHRKFDTKTSKLPQERKIDTEFMYLHIYVVTGWQWRSLNINGFTCAYVAKHKSEPNANFSHLSWYSAHPIDFQNYHPCASMRGKFWWIRNWLIRKH